jgi:hypothetical protein
VRATAARDYFTVRGSQVERMFVFLGATLGGWVGWAAGSSLSLSAGLLASLIGTGLGIWLTQRIVRDSF